jgi:hypothetical protein
MKRVIIMVASVMVFHNEISVQAGIGSAVGISGVLLYSLTKQKYEKLEQQELLASITNQKYEKLEQQELLASKEKKLTDVVNRARIAKRR